MVQGKVKAIWSNGQDIMEGAIPVDWFGTAPPVCPSSVKKEMSEPFADLLHFAYSDFNTLFVFKQFFQPHRIGIPIMVGI